MKNHRFKAIVLMGVLVSTSGFAARSDDAKKAIYEAKVLIQAAERSGAQTNAAFELKSARDHFNQSEYQLNERNWKQAQIAAKKSQRDAEVADAKSLAIKAEKSLNDLQTVVDSLRDELNNKRGLK